MQLGLRIKRVLFEFYLHRYHEIFISLTLFATIGFGYTLVRGVIYMYAPVEDAYYAQYHEIFISKINAKNYLKQFVPQDIVSQLNTTPKSPDITLFKQENINIVEATSWAAEQNLSKKLFDNRIPISQEEYKSIEMRLKKGLSWNKNYDGKGNRYLSEELQKKYDFTEFIDRLYIEFSNNLIVSVDQISKKVEKSLPLNTIVYKKFMGSNAGLPAVWFYRNVAVSIGEIEPILQQQNVQNELRYKLAYQYLIASSFFLGFLACSFFYFFQRRLTKVRNLVFYDGKPI